MGQGHVRQTLVERAKLKLCPAATLENDRWQYFDRKNNLELMSSDKEGTANGKKLLRNEAPKRNASNEDGRATCFKSREKTGPKPSSSSPNGQGTLIRQYGFPANPMAERSAAGAD